MTKIFYKDTRFRRDSLAMIDQANDIIADYVRQGYVLTLRQLYYQFVSRDLIENSQKSYSRLGSLINNARLAGLIDWEAIEDRTRNLSRNSHWDDPSDIIHSAARSFGIDKWAYQKHRVEIWVEKEALAGVFERVCQDLDVPFFACRGFVSQSEMWAAARRMKRYEEQENQRPVVLHFGDHDPSGIDMTRDIIDRFAMFDADVEVIRVALNMDQIEEYNPPPNPAKNTDSRYQDYLSRFGDECWELDALEPQVLVNLVQNHVFDYRDVDRWEQAVEEEESHQLALQKAAQNWSKISEFVAGL